MIINLAVNGSAIEKTGYGYTVLLKHESVCQTIGKYKEKIQTHVTEETIAKAVKKANRKRKIKGQDIAKTTIELTISGSGGSKTCDDVKKDYNRLLEEKTDIAKKGSEQGE